MIEQQDNRQFDDEQIMTMTQSLIEEAQEYCDEKLGPDRELATAYYLMEPLGNEIEGRSQVITSDVLDTIEWVMPSLMRVFMSGDEVVDIQPREESDTFDAQMAKEWVNFVLMNENDGFQLLYNTLKNGLLLKSGPVQCNWKQDYSSGPENYVGATQEEVMQLVQDQGYVAREIIPRMEQTEQMVVDPATLQPVMVPVQVQVFDVKGARKTFRKRLNVEAFPPEEFLTLPDTVSVPDGGTFFAVRRYETVGSLRAMGYEVDEDIPGGKIVFGYTDDGRAARDSVDRAGNAVDFEFQTAASTVDGSQRKVWCYWCYCKIDMDGDGLPEWWLVVRTQDRILSMEHVYAPYLYTWSPIPIPHKWVGLSLADMVVSLQALNTSLNRQILDYIYLTVNPRHEIADSNSNAFTLTDYADPSAGGAVRSRLPGAVTPLVNPPLPAEAFNYLESVHMQRENRTGITRYNQGIHADTLNKTASGIMSIMQAAQSRVEMIARIFAETLYKKLVYGILGLTAAHPDIAQEQVVRLGNKIQKLDPSKLRGRYDLVVNVGLGTGNKEQMLVHLDTLWQKQMEMMGFAGPGSAQPIVDLKNLYHTVREMAKNMGYRSVSAFAADPQETPPDPNWQPPPNPDLIKLEIERTKVDNDFKIKMAEIEIKGQELRLKEMALGVEAAAKVDESGRSQEAQDRRGRGESDS